MVERVLRCLLGIMVVTSGLLCPSANQTARSQGEPTGNRTTALRTFLLQYLGQPYPQFEQEEPTRYASAFVDLKGDGSKEALVYVTGRAWCGSGGCLLLVLAPEGGSFRIVTKITLTKLPIRILKTRSNGWHDISILIGGGGIKVQHEVVLRFDGNTYPSNPSIPPARRREGEILGKRVISSTSRDQLLYN